MADIQKSQKFDFSADRCFDNLARVCQHLGITVESQIPESRQLTGYWLTKGKMRLTFQTTCSPVNNMSSIVHIIYCPKLTLWKNRPATYAVRREVEDIISLILKKLDQSFESSSNILDKVSRTNPTRQVATRMLLVSSSTPPFNFTGILGAAAIGSSIFQMAPRVLMIEDLRLKTVFSSFAIITCLVGAILIKLSYRRYEGSPVQLLAKSVLAYNEGHFKEAVAYCDTILQTNPAEKRAWNNKGAVLYTLGELEGALECFDKALSLKAARLNRALILHEMSLSKS